MIPFFPCCCGGGPTACCPMFVYCGSKLQYHVSVTTHHVLNRWQYRNSVVGDPFSPILLYDVGSINWSASGESDVTKTVGSCMNYTGTLNGSASGVKVVKLFSTTPGQPLSVLPGFTLAGSASKSLPSNLVCQEHNSPGGSRIAIWWFCNPTGLGGFPDSAIGSGVRTNANGEQTNFTIIGNMRSEWWNGYPSLAGPSSCSATCPQDGSGWGHNCFAQYPFSQSAYFWLDGLAVTGQWMGLDPVQDGQWLATTVAGNLRTITWTVPPVDQALLNTTYYSGSTTTTIVCS